MTSTEELPLAIAFYAGLGLTALWYVRKIAHPDKKLWIAWFQFVGIIVGVVFGTLLVLVFVTMAAGIEGGVLGRAAIPIVVVGLLIPTWRYAKAVVGRPFKGNSRRPLKEYSLASASISDPEKF